MEFIWMKPPFGKGEPQEFEAKPEILVLRMVAGWTQCEAPGQNQEVKENVHN